MYTYFLFINPVALLLLNLLVSETQKKYLYLYNSYEQYS